VRVNNRLVRIKQTATDRLGHATPRTSRTWQQSIHLNERREGHPNPSDRVFDVDQHTQRHDAQRAFDLAKRGCCSRRTRTRLR
jgi:hypothetical protein